MNNEETLTEEKKEKYLDIYPIEKGKRILTFLADFFIVLISGIFLFNIAVCPIARHIVNYTEQENQVRNYSREKYNLLYDSKILFYDTDQKYSYTKNLETSMKKFITYYSEENTAIENEFIHHFFVDIRQKDLNFLYDFYKTNNKSGIEFFDYNTLDSNGLPVLLAEYKSDFNDYLKYPDDNKGTTAENNYLKFYQNFFTNIYGNLLNDIIANDLTVEGHELSYNELTKNIDDISNSQNTLITVSSFISFSITIICYFVLIPFLTKRGKTPATYFLRKDRVKKRNLNIYETPEKLSCLLFYVIAFMPSVVFIPFPTVDFANLFSNSILLILSGITFVYLLVSMFFLIFNNYNQTISDFASQTILISTEDLDSIYRLKGNGNI